MRCQLVKSTGNVVFLVDNYGYHWVPPVKIDTKEEFEAMMMEAFVTVEEPDNYRVKRGC